MKDKKMSMIMIVIFICSIMIFSIVKLNNKDNYQNNIIDNKNNNGNSSQTNDERYFWCDEESCISFASSKYVCAKGEKINVQIVLRDKNNQDELKTLELSNNNITMEKKFEAVGGDKSLYEYEVTCVSNGTTKIKIKGTNNKTSETTIDVFDEIIPVDSISLGKSRDNMLVGETKKLEVKFNPFDATNKNISWWTSDNKIVEVDNEGNVFAKAPGFARITAIAWNDDNVHFESHIDITVLSNNEHPYVGFNSPSYICKNGESIIIKSMACNDNLKSIDTKNHVIANLWGGLSYQDNNGCIEYTQKVHCISLGKTNITIAGSKTNSSSTITVLNNLIEPKSFLIDEYGFRNIKVGDSLTLSVSVSPSNVTNKKVYWRSSNTEAIIVDQTGTITAVGKGKSDITGTIYYDDDKVFSDTISFNAYQKDTDLTSSDLIYFERGTGSCQVGETKNITLHLSYIDANLIKLIGDVSGVKSLDESIATISKSSENTCLGCYNYEVKCLQKGNAIIEAKTSKGGITTYQLTIK